MPEPDQSIFYFIGVTTARSSIMDLFPRWMAALDRTEVAIQGIDLPIHAEPAAYRQVVAGIKADPKALGALVTTHKLDLFDAARDLFDWLDPYAALLGEVSCISKRAGRLFGHAKDPISAGMSLDAVLGQGYFGRTGGQALFFGAGGAASAAALHLATRPDPDDCPRRVTLVDILPGRLAQVEALLGKANAGLEVETALNADPAANDTLMAALPAHSLVVNATGMGKDIPGSPITDEARFPRESVVWEFNYRGELDFLHQAQRQEAWRGLRVEDGWGYFLHGWTQVIAEVLQLALDGPMFAKLAQIADSTR